MNMLGLVIAWAALATVVLVLAIYRRSLVRKDEIIHVGADINALQTVNKKLQVIDRWGKILTVIAFVFALVLLGMFLYNGWNQSSRIAS